MKTEVGVNKLRQIAEKSVDLVLKYRGTTSGEHGEGIARAEFSKKLFGEKIYLAFLEVKKCFDPDGIFNPGKIVDPPKMDDTSLLRFGPEYDVPYTITDTIFKYQGMESFSGLVEMCNGSAECRQLEQGVMCPSFQATRKEKHSTRGRANALRSAMMGLLGKDGMSSEELYKVLDLCLSCQACKSECPSSVDMAKLKSEFLYYYYNQNGFPLRVRFLSNIANLYKFGQNAAHLINLMLRGPGKWLLGFLGIHPSREIPMLTQKSFSSRFIKIKKSFPIFEDLKPVILFHDTFMEHNDPQIGIAATHVLLATGYRPIILEDKKCCGRPAVSKGLLNKAKKLAKYNIELFSPYAKNGVPIVGCEPSCISMLVEEYGSLLPGEDADYLAKMSMPIETFIVREFKKGNVSLNFDKKPRKVLFHGHCQQKSNFGTEDTLELLQLIPGCSVEEIQSGCCGMAGSFGYEKEHYDLSIEIAELSLAPSIRNASEETIISATGKSCREQIEHTTGRQAFHPIEVFESAIIDTT